MKHVHADLIHAWADGAEIQFHYADTDTWITTDYPMWNSSDQYRIKPKNKIRYGMINSTGDTIYICNKTRNAADCIKITFRGDSTKITAIELLTK